MSRMQFRNFLTEVAVCTVGCYFKTTQKLKFGTTYTWASSLSLFFSFFLFLFQFSSTIKIMGITTATQKKEVSKLASPHFCRSLVLKCFQFTWGWLGSLNGFIADNGLLMPRLKGSDGFNMPGNPGGSKPGCECSWVWNISCVKPTVEEQPPRPCKIYTFQTKIKYIMYNMFWFNI